ncbi:hypothetical protein GGF50DRAFT_121407 [Schizophyllum commune]
MVDEDAGTPLEQERNGAEGAAGEVYEDVGADVGPYCRDAALRREYRSTSMSAETSIASSAEDFPMADDGSSDGSSRMSTASYRQPEYALYTQLPPFPGTCPKALLGSVRYIYKDIDQFYSQALAAWFEYQDRERWSTQKIGFSVLHRPAVLSAWMKNKRPDKPAAQLVRNVPGFVEEWKRWWAVLKIDTAGNLSHEEPDTELLILALSPSPIQPRYPPPAGVSEAALRLALQGSLAHGACKPSENGNERPSPRSQESGFARLGAPPLLAAGEHHRAVDYSYICSSIVGSDPYGHRLVKTRARRVR